MLKTDIEILTEENNKLKDEIENLKNRILELEEYIRIVNYMKMI
jgi:predicted  nucleic acid-binding Zn-ribbon protein